MTTSTDSNSFVAENAITVLRLSRQKDAWLSRRIDFVRGMFDLAYVKKRHDLCEKYRDLDDILIITRIFKNSDAKSKREIKFFLEENALLILKKIWQTDYEKFSDLLCGEYEYVCERYKTDFDSFSSEILFYATNHETSDEFLEKIRKCNNKDELEIVFSEYPKYQYSKNLI